MGGKVWWKKNLQVICNELSQIWITELVFLGDAVFFQYKLINKRVHA